MTIPAVTLAAADTSPLSTALQAYAVCIAVFCIYLMLFWGVYRKAGKPTWVAFVPVLNVIEMVRLLRMPTWWIWLFLVPVVNLFMFLELAHRIARAFGYGWGLTLATMVVPYLVGPFLSLTSAEYRAERIPGAVGPAPAQA